MQYGVLRAWRVLNSTIEQDIRNEVLPALGLVAEDVTLRVFTQAETEITAAPGAFLRLIAGTLEIVTDNTVIRIDDQSMIVAKACSEVHVSEVAESYPRLAA